MQMITEEKIHPATKQYYKNKHRRNLKRVNIDIPADLWNHVGEQAEIQSIAKREIVVEALKEYIYSRMY